MSDQPSHAIDRNAVIEECAKVADEIAGHRDQYNSISRMVCDSAASIASRIRALASSPPPAAGTLKPADTVKRIAEIAEAVAYLSGVGGCETAGAIISYFATHPERVDQLLAEGLVSALGEDGDMWGGGCLTFHRKDGKVVTPQDLRISRQVRDIAKGCEQ